MTFKARQEIRMNDFPGNKFPQIIRKIITLETKNFLLRLLLPYDTWEHYSEFVRVIVMWNFWSLFHHDDVSLEHHQRDRLKGRRQQLGDKCLFLAVNEA